MGTKVQCESYFPGYYSMQNLSEHSNGGSWPLYYGDKTLTNGQYYNGFLPRALVDGYSRCEKDVVKQKMLEHEAIFKSQVYELHRLYRIQRDLMDEIRRNEPHAYHIPAEASLSSSLLASQLPSDEVRKWNAFSFPLVNSMGVRPPVSSAEDSHSHLSFIKGKNEQADLWPSQNGGKSKDCEIIESRPTKVRRKMFDLQLPADEYIDTEEVEQFGGKKVSEICSYPATGCCKTVADSGVKLFLGSNEKPGFQGDDLISDACLRSRNGLVDLNEANTSASHDMQGNASCQRENRDQELSVLKPQLLGFPNGTLQKLNRGRDDKTPHNLQIENKGHGREWMSYMLEAGHCKSNLASGSQGLQPGKLTIPSQPLQVMLNKAHESRTFLATDRSKEEIWRERTISALKFSERSHDLSLNNSREPVMSPNLINPYQFVPSSDLAKYCFHSASSLEKQISSFSQQSMSVQTYPCFNLSATLTSSQSSAQCPGIFGEKCHINGTRSNSGFGNGAPNQNGVHHGSSSGSNGHFTSTGFDCLNCSNDSSNVAIEHINHTSTMYFKGSSHIDLNSANDIKLDVALSHSSSNRAVPEQGLKTIDGERKHDVHLEVLPWLRAKTVCKNEAAYAKKDLHMVEMSFSHAASNQISDKIETEKGIGMTFAQIITSASCAHDNDSKGIDISDCPTTKKILGFSIFERSDELNNESPHVKSPSASLCPSKGEDTDDKEQIGLVDINYSCDPSVSDSGKDIDAVAVENRGDGEVANLRHYIDLNSCIGEDEALLTPSISCSDVKTARERYLEAPVAPEPQQNILFGEASQSMTHQMTVQSSQHKAECLQDNLVTIAAEAIVVISSSGYCNQMEDDTCSPPEEASMDPLHCLAEVASSCADDLEKVKHGEDNEESSSDGIDYFESMTLKLTEVNIDEHLFEFPVPGTPKVEEMGTDLFTNKPRKGQARRGRQRRDFQRDILPGLASLSRHEVTEDLQTFGGLMRATGHHWHSGLTRRTAARNGYRRCRRQSVVIAATALVASQVCSSVKQQRNNIEVGLEDKSLTGWGKTTKRPRRQRCPAGNPPFLPLT